MELLDHPRLAAQLVGLERRTSRSGKDSIDHSPGGHDDLINSAAGVLVGLDLDRRPGLVNQDDLLTGNAPHPMPRGLMSLYSTVCVSKAGIVAVVYIGCTREGLLVVDYDCAPLGASTFMSAAERTIELGKACKVFSGMLPCMYAHPSLVRAMSVAGVNAEQIPDYLLDAEQLLVPAATHIKAGIVKVCVSAHEKAKTSPFGGALDFRSGDNGDDPLRQAALWAIAIGLDPQQ